MNEDDILGGVVDDIITQKKNGGTMLGQSLAVSADRNPESEAAFRKISEITGVPVASIRIDGGAAAKKIALVQGNQDLPFTAPATSEFLSNPANASVAHDDVQNLSLVEQATSALSKVGKYVDENVLRVPITQGYVQYQKGVGGMYQWIGDTLLQPLVDAVAPGEGSNFLSNWGRNMQAEANMVQKEIDAEHPVDPNSWTGAVRGGMSSTFLQAPTMAVGALASTAKGAAAASLGAMGFITGGQTYGEKREAGLSEFQAGMAATGTATVEIATEMFPTEKVFELLKPGAKLGIQTVFSKVGQIYGAELIGESVATFLQDVIDKAYDKPNMSTQEVMDKVSDYIQSGEAWQNFENTIKTTLVQSTVMAGGGASIGKVHQVVQERQQAKSQEAHQALLDVLTSAEASRLQQRSPESFAEFAQTAAEHHGVETVYLQADRVLEEAQKAGWTQEKLVDWAGQYGVSQEDLNTALQTGGQLEMEFGKVVANMKTDEALGAMQKDLSIDPSAHPISRVEASAAAESEHQVRLSELYQAEQDQLINPDDIAQWKKDLLEAPGIKGRVTEQHLDLMAATANTYSKLSGMPAIDLLNKMLGKGGLQAVKFKDFQAGQGELNQSPDSRQGMESLSIRKSQDSGMLVPAVVKDGEVLAAGVGATHYDVHSTVKATVAEGVTDANGFVTPDGQFLDRKESLAWLKENRPDVYKALDKVTKKNGLESQDYASAEGLGQESAGLIDSFIKKQFSTALFQAQNTDPLGALQIEGQNVVSLFEKADKSTFLHESGHIFLNFVKEMAELHGIQPEVWAAAKEWLEVGEDGVLTREQQERWAEAFEVYLMEGTAPTPTLKTAFRAFKSWLTRIYGSLTSRRSGARDTYSGSTDRSGEKIAISPEIRAMFDKMLATEQEIEEAKQKAALVAMLDEKLLNTSGFTKEQIDEYRRIVAQADGQAKETRDSFKMAGYKERMAEQRVQAETEAKQIPIYGIISQLAEQEVAINKESLRTLLADDLYRKLPDVPGLWSKDGANINQVAVEHGEKFGYQSGADLAADLAGMQPLKLWIDKRVAQMEATHDLSQDTSDAIRTSGLRRMLEVESAWLEKQSARANESQSKKEKAYNEAWKQAEAKLVAAIAEGKLQTEIDDLTAAAKDAKEKVTSAFQQARATALPRQAIRAWAEKVIEARGLKAIHNIGKLLSESRQHRQQAIALAKKGNWEGALKSNEQARLTEELISQSYKAQKQWQKMQKQWKNIAKWTNDNHDVKVGEDFRDQINRLLAQYSIADKAFNPTAVDLHTFVEQLAAQDDTGMGTALAEWLGKEIAPATMLTWSKLNDLNDALQFLYGHGRAEVEGLKTSKGEFVAAIADQIVQSQNDLKGDKLATLRSEAGAWNRTVRNVQKKYRKFFANTAILRYIAQRLDGYTNVGGNGTMGRAEQLVQEVINGTAEANVRWIELNKQIEPILQQLFTDRAKIYSDLQVPKTFSRYGMVWTRERVITACLNMGNESNLQRLTDGYGIDHLGVQALQSKLTAEEWRSIQKLWDVVDSLWPEIAAVHKRINFFSPKKIEAGAFSVQTADNQSVNLDGGYWPISYDKSLDGDVAKWDEKSDILASSEAILQTPVAKSGFTKGRNEKVKRSLNLSLSVLSTHLSDTIKYITVAEKIRDADRVFRNKSLAARNEETIGADMQEMIRPALKHVLRPEPNIYGPFETGRVKMSAYYMAYNAWTALQNVTGVFPAIRATGMQNYINGTWQVLRAPLQAQKTMLEASKYMRLREANIERDLKKQVREFKIDGITIGGKRYNLEDVQAVGWAGIRMIDAVVALPAWWGKYNAEVEKHGDITKAVEAADTAVNKALGSGLAIDATGIGRHKFFSLLAPFMSFAATQQEVLASETEAWKEGKMKTSDWLYGQLMVWVLPSMMSTFLQGALMYGLSSALGGGDDDKKKHGMDYLTDLISYRLMGIPFVRDVSNAVIQGVEGKAPITSARMPVTEAYKMIQQLFYRAGNMVEQANEQRTRAVAWAAADLASLGAGIPVTRIYERWMKGTKQMDAGGWWMNHFVPQEKKH